MARLIILILFALGVIGIVHAVEYMVYPMDRRAVAPCKELNDRLQRFLGSDNVKMFGYKKAGVTDFWLISATLAQTVSIRGWVSPDGTH